MRALQGKIELMIVNWNTDEAKMKKEDPEGYKTWRLVQLINYGLWGEKLDKKEIKEKWPEIKDRLDIDSRKAVEFFLFRKKWKKEPGLAPDRKNFWNWYRKIKISALNSISLEELLLRRSTLTTGNL